MQELRIKRPDDWHLHLRDGRDMEAIITHSSRYFGRALIMPNLVPPVDTVAAARAYRQRILSAVPDHHDFQPLMALYLTASTTIAEIAAAAAAPEVVAVKLYPAGATTNSAAGVGDVMSLMPVLEAMAKHGLVLAIHGEVVDSDIDIFDREAVFIDRYLAPIVARLPELKIVLEHVTTAEGIDFVTEASDQVAATITAHHLLLNRNDLLVGGIKPHYYCLPIVKRERHRQRLLVAATSGSSKFFLGTDSAPHARNAKESACGCAGCFTSSHALPWLATAFETCDKLTKLEGFSSLFGARFYGYEPSEKMLRLIRKDQRIPDDYCYGDGCVVPFRAGEICPWQFDF